MKHTRINVTVYDTVTPKAPYKEEYLSTTEHNEVVAKYREALKVAEEALKFYANGDHKFADGEIMTWVQFGDMDDYGSGAREALAQISKLTGGSDENEGM